MAQPKTDPCAVEFRFQCFITVSVIIKQEYLLKAVLRGPPSTEFEHTVQVNGHLYPGGREERRSIQTVQSSNNRHGLGLFIAQAGLPSNRLDVIAGA